MKTKLKAESGKLKLFVLLAALAFVSHASGQRLLKQSSTAQTLTFLMVSSSDHVTAVTGLSPTVTLSKAGGSFASPAGAVTEIGSGWYKVAGNATDTNTLGSLILHATGTGADPTDREYAVVAFDPQSATNLGLTNLDVAVSTRNATAPDNSSITAIKAKTDNLPAAPASTTNITAGTITTVTNLTNLPSIPANWLTAAGIAAGALNGKGDWNIGDSSGTTTLLSRLTSTRAGYLDNISVAPPTVAAIWDEAIAGHLTAGTMGAKLNAAGSAGDPWAALLPASYSAGTAGAIFGKLALIDPNDLTISSPVSQVGNKIAVRTGDTWEIPITGLGNLTGRTKLWFAVNAAGAPDADAKLFIEETDGLTRVNGAAYATAADGSITVDDAAAGDITITVAAEVTAELSGSTSWAIKWRNGAGAAVTLATGPFVITKAGIEATE